MAIYKGIQICLRTLYPCYRCDYEATTPGHLKTHTKIVHILFKYTCDLCDHRPQFSNIQKHIKRVHRSKKHLIEIKIKPSL